MAKMVNKRLLLCCSMLRRLKDAFVCYRFGYGTLNC